jgi:hypothetical protein
MTHRTSPNTHILESVAARIAPLLDEVVFVGGQVVELLLTDPAAIRIRATTDVDVVVMGTRAEYHRMEEKLRVLGFLNDQSEGAPVCRWKTRDGYILDLMPVDELILGFSNEWYRAAVEQTQQHELRSGLTVSIPRPPVFLATKLAAFAGRGHDDLLGSHDLEDVITLVAGRPEILEELETAEQALRAWVAAEVAVLLEQADFDYAIQGALPDAVRIPEFRREVLDRFRAVAAFG